MGPDEPHNNLTNPSFCVFCFSFLFPICLFVCLFVCFVCFVWVLFGPFFGGGFSWASKETPPKTKLNFFNACLFFGGVGTREDTQGQTRTKKMKKHEKRRLPKILLSFFSMFLCFSFFCFHSLLFCISPFLFSISDSNMVMLSQCNYLNIKRTEKKK